MPVNAELQQLLDDARDQQRAGNNADRTATYDLAALLQKIAISDSVTATGEQLAITNTILTEKMTLMAEMIASITSMDATLVQEIRQLDNNLNRIYQRLGTMSANQTTMIDRLIDLVENTEP